MGKYDCDFRQHARNHITKDISSFFAVVTVVVFITSSRTWGLLRAALTNGMRLLVTLIPKTKYQI